MNHVRVLLLVGLLLLGGGAAVAQRPVVPYSDTVRIRSLNPARWVVSFNPLALFDPENTVQVGLERLLAGRHSVRGEFGYGPPGLNIWPLRLNNQDRETWRGRAEWRLYTRRSRLYNRWQPHRTVIEKPLGNYLAVDLYYKQTNANQSGNVGRACDDGSCQYFQRFQSRIVKYVGATHLKIGRQGNLYIPDENGRIIIDVYIGLGLRRRWVENYGLPEPEDGGSYTFDNRNGVFDDLLFDRPVRLSVTTGFQFGYVF